MKGYKGMNPDMTCRGMKFEVGKTYHVDDNIELCVKGLHFCEKLINVFDFYDKDESRFFYVESGENIKTDGKKSVTSELTIIAEVSKKKINRAFYGNGYGDGDGYGYGYGHGNGDGYGYGDGDGYGYGYGHDNGDGYGYGDGNGDGDGDGYGHGDGNGCGGGYGIQKILTFIN